MPSWLRVKEVLALALEEPLERRSALLETACAGDRTLRAEVESLLEAAAAGTFIEPPDACCLETAGDRDPHLGRQIGPYAIERCIGRGGMGDVYLARRADHEFEHSVALKTIRRGMDSDVVVRRFRHERQILASLNHPNIARLFDGGTTPEGLPYFVMEYVAGTPIDRYADDHGLTTAARLNLCLGVLDAVQHAHDRNIVHRDLKPGNVLITSDGQPRLLDFGIAKILDASADGDSTLTSLARPMTPHYASPEQMRGEPISAATDVYALGLLLYELLTGHRAFQLARQTPEEMARRVCEEEPARPSTAVGRTETVVRSDGTTITATPRSVSEVRDGSPEALRRRLAGPLDAIVMKALRKAPSLRYPTVAALADDIRCWLERRPVSAGRDALRYRARRMLGRHRAALGVAALLLVIAALATVALRRAPALREADGPGSAQAPPQISPRPAAAILGFANRSGRPEDQWLSTAMAKMLTTELAADGQMRVLPAEIVAQAAQDLGVDASRLPDPGQLARLRRTLGSDYVVLGSFVANGDTPSRALRVDLRVFRQQDDPLAIASMGDESGLFVMMSGVGRDVRTRLGLRESPPAAVSGAHAGFPQGLEATRLYAEGIARLRVMDAVRAETLLTQAAALEPQRALIQTALASAWTALGYDARAAEAAQKAFDASAQLTREDRLKVEGRLYDVQKKATKAVDVYRTLWGFFSDNIEYGLLLAGSQTLAGRGTEALVTVAGLRHAPSPQNEDPRIDMVEAQADEALGDFPGELAVLHRALASAEKSGARSLAARARLQEGPAYFNQGDLAKAEHALDQAREAFIAAGDSAGAASALNSLGSVLADQQDIGRAQGMYEASMAASEQIGNRRMMSAALNNLGVLLKDQRRFDEARRAHERSLALRREIGDRNWTAVSLSNIGVVLFEQDRLRDATAYYKESLDICREIGDKRGLVRALHNLAIVQREVGNPAEARVGYEESLATRVEIGDKRGQVMGRVELGILLLQQGEIEAARKAQREAARLAAEINLKPGEAQAEFQLGEIALAGDNLPEARRHHVRALALRRDMHETRTLLESQLALATLTLEEGKPIDAERDAQVVAQALGHTDTPLHALAELLTARARLVSNDIPGALQSLAVARQLSSQTERVSLKNRLALVDAEIAAAQGNVQAARQRLTRLHATLAAAGMVMDDLDLRLVLLHIDRAQERRDVEAEARALEKDAVARGAKLIARRAHAGQEGMSDTPDPRITQLLQAWQQGDAPAGEALVPLVYAELRRIARIKLSAERSGHTLQATALVHEAWLRLMQQHGAQWHNRAQFFAIAAEAMRRILVATTPVDDRPPNAGLVRQPPTSTI